MNALTTALGIVAVLAVIAAALAYTRLGTLKAATQTIGILKDQVDTLDRAYKDLQAKYEALMGQHEALKNIVTNAEPIRELTRWAKDMVTTVTSQREAEHQENILALARLEGGVARLEAYFLGGHPGQERPTPPPPHDPSTGATP